jgi:hypothetical protein
MDVEFVPAKVPARFYRPLDLKTKFCFNGTVSTVLLPMSMLPPKYFEILGGPYETCIFYGDNSEVAERYRSIDEALVGHEKWVKQAEEEYSKRNHISAFLFRLRRLVSRG